MAKKRLVNKVPELLASHGIDATQLHWDIRIALNTAKRWADQDEAQLLERLDVDILLGLAELFDIRDISELIEIVDAE
jgi:hypothetical protein